ncbi:MAG: Gfo/Idh/MocA family oxidoreductase [Ruminococcaceae bacterium]|nr:Gfo/Idh/MocA family oxidoreductase [Oscillospiraceae bacterium]
MRKIAVCGVWHVHAPDYTRVAIERGEVVGVWDENADRKNEFCEKFGLKAFDTLNDLLASDADGVIVCASTDTHADVMVKIADAKKDIFTEKVLALTDEDCDRVAEAVERNQVKFVISLVQKSCPGPLTVKSIVDSGELGKIAYVRFRNCHSGSSANWLPKHFYDAKECGGGAMIDLGAHGMYLIDWILGMPSSYKSIFTNACINEDANKLNSDKVEDNATTVMGYDNGAIAVNETGFVSGASPMILEIDGEKGYVRFSENKVIKRVGGQLCEVPMIQGKPSPIVQFVTENYLGGCGIEEAKNLTHMMVEAYK